MGSSADNEIVEQQGVEGCAKVQALGVGDWQGREFAEAWGEVSAGNGWPLVESIDDACQMLAHVVEPPELIFLAQPFPGQYTEVDVNRLQQLAPLTRVVLVVGSWAEGELRTGTPPSGVIRLYWYELESWWQAGLRRHEANLPPLWSAPLDQHHAGRWSTDACGVAAGDRGDDTNGDMVSDAALTVLIAAADYGVYETLAAVLLQQGIASIWRGREEASNLVSVASVGIWDGGQLSERELVGLTKFCQQIEGPVVALLDFPRIEHIEQARAAGATTVLAKPYVVEELVAAILR